MNYHCDGLAVLQHIMNLCCGFQGLSGWFPETEGKRR